MLVDLDIQDWLKDYKTVGRWAPHFIAKIKVCQGGNMACRTPDQDKTLSKINTVHDYNIVGFEHFSITAPQSKAKI